MGRGAPVVKVGYQDPPHSYIHLMHLHLFRLASK